MYRADPGNVKIDALQFGSERYMRFKNPVENVCSLHTRKKTYSSLVILEFPRSCFSFFRRETISGRVGKKALDSRVILVRMIFKTLRESLIY